MTKLLKVLLLILVLLAPILFYRYLNRSEERLPETAGARSRHPVLPLRIQEKARVAIVFSNMGASLNELKRISKLDVPVTVSVIPDQKFSRKVANISHRLGYSVLLQLPFIPEDPAKTFCDRDHFIRPRQSLRQRKKQLRHYMNCIRVAIGVSSFNRTPSVKDETLIREVIEAVAGKKMFFIENTLNPDSIVPSLSSEAGVPWARAEEIVSIQDKAAVKEKLCYLISRARKDKNGKVIIRVLPTDQVLETLGEDMAEFEREAEFVTLKEYFGS